VAGLDWDTAVPDGWAAEVTEWEWRDWTGDGGVHLGWRKWGPCPRCEDTMAVYKKAVQAIVPVSTVVARCNCNHAHPKRPAGQTNGCGVGTGPTVEIPVS